VQKQQREIRLQRQKEKVQNDQEEGGLSTFAQKRVILVFQFRGTYYRLFIYFNRSWTRA